MGAFYDSPAFGGYGGSSEVGGIRILRADRMPCPVCGHPTGDCAGESGPPKTIFGYNSNSSLDENVTYIFEEDYLEEREIAPGVITKILVYPKGKQIPLSLAKELGLLK